MTAASLVKKGGVRMAPTADNGDQSIAVPGSVFGLAEMDSLKRNGVAGCREIFHIACLGLLRRGRYSLIVWF
jgi:hypothetical protein